MDITPKYEHLPKVIIKEVNNADATDETASHTIIKLGESSQRLRSMRIAVASSIAALGIAAGVVLLSEEKNDKTPITIIKASKQPNLIHAKIPTITPSKKDILQEKEPEETEEKTPEPSQQNTFKKPAEKQPYIDPNYDEAIGKKSTSSKPTIIREAPF